MAAMNDEREFERAQEWADIDRVLDDCLRDLDPMVPSFRLDRGVLFGIYKIIRHIEERWLEERFADYGRYRARVRKLVPFIY